MRSVWATILVAVAIGACGRMTDGSAASTSSDSERPDAAAPALDLDAGAPINPDAVASVPDSAFTSPCDGGPTGYLEFALAPAMAYEHVAILVDRSSAIAPSVATALSSIAQGLPKAFVDHRLPTSLDVVDYDATTTLVTSLTTVLENLRTAGRAAVIVTAASAPSPAVQSAALQKVAEASKNVPTFVIGVGPLPSADVSTFDPAFLGALAVAGGTRASSTCDPAATAQPAELCYAHVMPLAPGVPLTARAALVTGACTFDFAGTDSFNRTAVVGIDANGKKHVALEDTTEGFSPERSTRIHLNGQACVDWLYLLTDLRLLRNCKNPMFD